MAGEEVIKKTNWIDDTREYLGDIRSEMKRVTWPSRNRVQSTTVVVLLSVLIFAVYFTVIDRVIENTVTRAYSALAK